MVSGITCQYVVVAFRQGMLDKAICGLGIIHSATVYIAEADALEELVRRMRTVLSFTRLT